MRSHKRFRVIVGKRRYLVGAAEWPWGKGTLGPSEQGNHGGDRCHKPEMLGSRAYSLAGKGETVSAEAKTLVKSSWEWGE